MSPSPFCPAVAGTLIPSNITLQLGTDSFPTAAANSLSTCNMSLRLCSFPVGIFWDSSHYKCFLLLSFHEN